jgi:quinol-cytochrome oxidoreductase complex cytochrome b subunit
MTYDFYYWLGYILGIAILAAFATGIIIVMVYAATRRNLIDDVMKWWRK